MRNVAPTQCLAHTRSLINVRFLPFLSFLKGVNRGLHKDPQDHPQFWWLARSTQNSACTLLTTPVYCRERIQSKVSEGTRYMGWSPGTQVPSPRGLTSDTLIPPALSYDSACEMSYQRLHARGAHWGWSGRHDLPVPKCQAPQGKQGRPHCTNSERHEPLFLSVLGMVRTPQVSAPKCQSGASLASGSKNNSVKPAMCQDKQNKHLKWVENLQDWFLQEVI